MLHTELSAQERAKLRAYLLALAERGWFVASVGWALHEDDTRPPRACTTSDQAVELVAQAEHEGSEDVVLVFSQAGNTEQGFVLFGLNELRTLDWGGMGSYEYPAFPMAAVEELLGE